MFTGLKDKLRTVKNTVGFFVLDDSPVKLQPPPVNTQAGAGILQHFQDQWQDIHELNEQNASNAQKVAVEIQQVAKRMASSQTNIDLVTHLLTTSKLTSNIEQCLTQVDQLYKTCEVVEQKLLDFEVLLEDIEFEGMIKRHKALLESYKIRKQDNLNKLKESLDKHYVQQVAKFENSKKHVLEEREKVFQDAFKGDLEVYKSLGTIPKVDLPKTQSGAILEEIQLDFDPNELEEFFNNTSASLPGEASVPQFIMLLEREYLKQQHLNGFDNYKYNCKDTGILSIYVMHPFWNWVVQYCPKNIAPNLLTFSGFMCTIAMYLMFTFMDYNFTASDPEHPEVPNLPRWSWFLAALLLFLAYTLDGIDGKQARRTGTSGPLGELFDHGLDSYTAGLMPAAMYSIFGRGARFSVPPFRMFFTFCNVLINFYLSHFEKYNTGVMFLPWGYDFTMCGMIIIFFITGIGGSDLWQYSLPGGITNGVLVELTLYISSMITNWPIVFYNIYKSYRDKTGYMRSFSEAIRPLIPLVLNYLIILWWIFESPSDIIERDPRALFFLLGTIFSNISCRVIVAQMSSTRCDWFNWMFVPTVLAIMISGVTQSPTLELYLLYALCLGTSIAHIHYGTCVVRQMCRHFKINCFTIGKRSD
ncbi:hypothetical protein YQE_11925, partial [Dendroctonus ponderosae]